MQGDKILNVTDIKKSFGGLNAVDGVDFDVARGCIKSIIGPNGAGKTTIFNILAGAFPPTSGKIIYKGRDISRLKSYKITCLGIARTFQNVKLFGNMTVLQNVMLGRHCRTKTGFFSAAFRLPSARREEAAICKSALERLEFVGLADKAGLMATSLPFGRQKVLEVARALASEPELLLLDEPAAGLNTRETEEMAALIARIRETGVTVLLVEHDMSLVMDISDEVLVLDAGKKLAEGTPHEVQNDPEVVRIYLGQDYLNDRKGV